MNNDAILASISKIHAYRYAKEKQRGVKFGENQSTSTATKLTTTKLPIGVEDFSVEFYGNSYGSDANLGYSFIRYTEGDALNKKFSTLARQGTNGVELLTFGESTFKPSYVIEDNDSLFHMVITRSGTNVTLSINGVKINDFTTYTIIDFGNMDFLIANSRNVALFRVWNYALSADEITTLYNNGNPLGYVVPKEMREIGPEWEITNPNCEFTLNSPDNVNITDVINLNSSYLYELKYTIDEYDFDPDSGYRIIGGTGITITGALNFSVIVKDGLGVPQTCFIRLKPGQSQRIIVYAGTSSTYTTRNLKLTILSLRPVGLLAEYLPQNLVGSSTDKTIATTWLDSAKQLPWSDAYLPPLLQSKGGYDMVANGAPEVLFNE